jgi:CrcB protein
VTALLVALGAAVGAPLRYHLDRSLQRRADSAFPVGTLVVNVCGSFVLGVLLATTTSTDARALLGIGFCGAFTTWSTFGYETARLAEDGARWLAGANVVATLGLGLTAAALGWWLGALS